MPPADAAKLLELAPEASPEVIEARFLELRTKLEEKIARAPTPGLKEKYRVSLASITEAFETLTLAADSSSLPVLRRTETAPARTASPVPAGMVEPLAPPPAVPPPPPVFRPSFFDRFFALLRAGFVGLFVMGSLGIFLGVFLGAYLEYDVADSEGMALVVADLVVGVVVSWAWYRRILRKKARRLIKEHEAALAAARDPAVRRKQAEAREFRLVLTSAVALLVIGGIWIVYHRIDKSLAERAVVDRTVSEAMAKQSEEENRQHAAATEKAEKERQDKVMIQLRTRMAELNVLYDAAMKIESVSSRTLSDLKSEERDLTRDPKTASTPAAKTASNKVKAQELYVAWLDRYLPANPAKIAKARADELISARAADDATAAVEAYADALKELQAELKSNEADSATAGNLDAIRQSAAKGDVQNMRWLGRTLTFGGKLPKDPVEGFTWLKRAAEAGGDKDDLYWVGSAYLEGRGVAQDTAAAIAWFKKSAEAGDTAALGELADIFQEGKGVPKDAAQALAWRRQAADKGDFFQLAYFLSDGPKETRDPAASLEWYRKAAEKGDEVAMYDLGIMSGNGDGMARDLAAATEWYRKAADKGYAPGMNMLGRNYLNGRGVEKNEATGLDWLKRAAKRNNAEAQQELKSRGLSW